MSDRIEITCPHAKSPMTPCVARDGGLAVTDVPDEVCVGCGESPVALLAELGDRYEPASKAIPEDATEAADRLTVLVADYINQS